VFLILTMNTMLVIPTGIDLELCLGKDGHVDFLLNSCQDGPSSKVPASEPAVESMLNRLLQKFDRHKQLLEQIPMTDKQKSLLFKTIEKRLIDLS